MKEIAVSHIVRRNLARDRNPYRQGLTHPSMARGPESSPAVSSDVNMHRNSPSGRVSR